MSKSTRDSGDALIVTDPYSVPVGKMAPNNPPFIVERSKELPAGQKSFRAHDTRNREEKGEDSQVDAAQYVPDHFHSHCQENQTIERYRIHKTVAKSDAQSTSGLRVGL